MRGLEKPAICILRKAVLGTKKEKDQEVNLVKKICFFINSQRKTGNRFLFTIIHYNNRNYSYKRK